MVVGRTTPTYTWGMLVEEWEGYDVKDQEEGFAKKCWRDLDDCWTMPVRRLAFICHWGCSGGTTFLSTFFPDWGNVAHPVFRRNSIWNLSLFFCPGPLLTTNYYVIWFDYQCHNIVPHPFDKAGWSAGNRWIFQILITLLKFSGSTGSWKLSVDSAQSGVGPARVETRL